MNSGIPAAELRTYEQLREHYEIERELADRLRTASREERLELYGSMYNELFQRVPLHPQLVKKADPEAYAWSVDRQMCILEPFLDRATTFMEIGAGDCALSAMVARRVRKVYAVDVSNEITTGVELPENVEIRICDGITMPVADGSLDVAYSNQVMEHLHPDDAFEQLRNIYNCLTPGGVYMCVTPNRLSGPHDISKYFNDSVASGFHLKEYTVAELDELFHRAGFTRVKACIGGRGHYFCTYALPVESLEKILALLSSSVRRTLANRFLVSGILGVRIVGTR
jgi:SAM-dependent methyltransferase